MTPSKSIKASIYRGKYELLKPGTIRAYETLLKNQNLSVDELESLHWQMVNRVVLNAFQKCPFYRQFYAGCDFLGKKVLDKEYFEQLPPLTRNHIRESGENILCHDVKTSQCNLISTGGSTGQPVCVYHPKSTPRAAALWRMLSWWDADGGDDIATIYREPSMGIIRRLVDAGIWYPRKRILLNASLLTDDSINLWIARCNQKRPSILHGYLGAVDHVAQYILKHGLAVWSPKAIWVTSAPLTEVHRNRIEAAFHSKVYDQYGSCEIFYMASETPWATGLSVFHDLRRIEAVDTSNRSVPDGNEGRLLVTDLENLSFPLIRYEIGDMGAYLSDQKHYGLPFPRMAPVKGRISDLLTFPNGQSVSGEFWTTLFDDYPEAVEQFQVVQRIDQSLEIKYLPSSSERTNAVIEIVSGRVRKLINNCVPVKFSAVREIPADRGKTRFVIKEK